MATENSVFNGGPEFGPNRDGSFDLVNTNTSATADNVIDVKYTTSGSLASGYDQGVYVALNLSGTTSGGTATQRHSFATDISISGTHASWIGGGYVYISGSGTLTSGVVYGLNLDIQELGQCDYIANLFLQRSSTSTAATTVDAYILCAGQGTASSAATIMYVQGKAPTYFLQMAADTANGFLDLSAPASMTADRCLKVRLGTTNYNIPMVTAT